MFKMSMINEEPNLDASRKQSFMKRNDSKVFEQYWEFKDKKFDLEFIMSQIKYFVLIKEELALETLIDPNNQTQLDNYNNLKELYQFD